MGWIFERFSVLKIVRSSSEPHTVSYSIDTGILPQEYSGWCVKWSAHFHLVWRLRMSGTMLYIPPWRGR